jgi:CRP-like cAMP-binding protein
MRNREGGKVANSNRAIEAQAISVVDVSSFVTSLGAERSVYNFKPKETIYRQGDPADAVFFLREGKAQIAVVSEQGKEGVVAILEAGQFLGEGCLTGQPLRLASAIALEASAAVRIEKETMAHSLHEQPAFSEMFMKHLLSRNVQIEADLVDQLFNSTEKRLARTLLLLAHFGKDGKMESIVPKISQEVLAARVGTTRSRVNFFMNKFRKLGFIDYNGDYSGELNVHSSLLNVVVHN